MRIKMIFIITALAIGLLNGQALVWQKTYGGKWKTYGEKWYGEANALQVLNDGSMIIAGDANDDVYVFKIDKDGNKIWEKAFGGFKDDWANDLQVLDDGSIVIAGVNKEDYRNELIEHLYVLKLDKYGNKIWENYLGSDGQARAIQVLGDGSAVVTGWIESYAFGASDNDVYVVKINTKDGNRIWEKNFRWK